MSNMVFVMSAASGEGGPMLVPPVAQTGGRSVGDTAPRAQSSAGTAALWPLTPAHLTQPSNHQSQATPALAATPAPAHTQGIFIVFLFF